MNGLYNYYINHYHLSFIYFPHKIAVDILYDDIMKENVHTKKANIKGKTLYGSLTSLNRSLELS